LLPLHLDRFQTYPISIIDLHSYKKIFSSTYTAKAFFLLLYLKVVNHPIASCE